MTDLLDLDIALHRVLDAVTATPDIIELPVSNAAQYRLAADQHARSAVPPFANSAMDGYAVISSDPALLQEQGLAVTQTVFAGAAPAAAVSEGQCARIFTGAALPPAADAVVAQEEVEALPGQRARFTTRPTAGACVRHRGGDVDIGQRIAEVGTLIDPAHLALLIAAGIARIPVHRRPRVAIISTGEELRPPGATLAPGSIHDSNGPMLAALCRQQGAEVVECVQVGDDPGSLRRVMQESATQADALICSGGVSVGAADHVRDVLSSDGEVAFWRLALKPGKPFAFGHLSGRPFFGLPGNPVSALVTFVLLVQPALHRLAGARTVAPALRLPARLSAPVRKRPGRRDFQRGHFHPAASGVLEVTAAPRQDSNILSTLTLGNCLIDLPREAGDLDTGTMVQILPLPALLQGLPPVAYRP